MFCEHADSLKRELGVTVNSCIVAAYALKNLLMQQKHYTLLAINKTQGNNI